MLDEQSPLTSVLKFVQNCITNDNYVGFKRLIEDNKIKSICNLRDRKGETILITCSYRLRYGDDRFLNTLLDYFDNNNITPCVQIPNRSGLTAVYIATLYINLPIITRLSSYTTNFKRALRSPKYNPVHYAYFHSINIFKFFISIDDSLLNNMIINKQSILYNIFNTIKDLDYFKDLLRMKGNFMYNNVDGDNIIDVVIKSYTTTIEVGMKTELKDILAIILNEIKTQDIKEGNPTQIVPINLEGENLSSCFKEKIFENFKTVIYNFVSDFFNIKNSYDRKYVAKVLVGVEEMYCDNIEELSLLQYINKREKEMNEVISCQLYGLCKYNENLAIITNKFQFNIQTYFQILEHDKQESKIIKLFYDVIEKVYKLNCLGVLHMDIKVDNVMLNAEGDVFLIDYGISCLLQAGNTNNTTYIYVKNLFAHIYDKETKLLLHSRCDIIKTITIKPKSLSYFIDVFCIATMFLGLFLKDNVNYISYEGKIYRYIDDKHYKVLDRISISKIPEKLLPILTKMIDVQNEHSITLKQILDLDYHVPSHSVSTYTRINKNLLLDIFKTTSIHYLPYQIINQLNNLVYLEEIHHTFSNDFIIMNKIENNDEFLRKLNTIVFGMIDENSLTLDGILNIVELANSYENIDNNMLTAMKAFSHYSMIHPYQFNINKDTYNKYEIKKYFIALFNLHKTKLHFNSYNIHIQYIIVHMQKLNATNEILNDAENYMFSNLLSYLLDGNDKNINIWKLIQTILYNFLSQHGYNDFLCIIEDYEEVTLTLSPVLKFKKFPEGIIFKYLNEYIY